MIDRYSGCTMYAEQWFGPIMNGKTFKIYSTEAGVSLVWKLG